MSGRAGADWKLLNQRSEVSLREDSHHRRRRMEREFCLQLQVLTDGFPCSTQVDLSHLRGCNVSGDVIWWQNQLTWFSQDQAE